LKGSPDAYASSRVKPRAIFACRAESLLAFPVPEAQFIILKGLKKSFCQLKIEIKKIALDADA